MTPADVTAQKAAIRAAMRAARRGFAGPPLGVPAPFTALLDRWTGVGGVIASYVPVGGEADPAPLAAAAIAHGWRLALPHVSTRAAPMRFLSCFPDAPLVPGPFGLRQPESNAEPLDPDIILTPLIAFDDRLARLGQGAGHYDRAFAELPLARRLGIGWSIQRVPKVPVDPWDVPLHGVVTESGWIGPDSL